jgi:hypothetical protein
MPLPAALLTIITNSAPTFVIQGARYAWSKMPWAKDPRKVQSVERKIAVLVDEASELARSVPVEKMDAQLDRLLKGFHQDLLNEGIEGDDAERVLESVRAQVRATILHPLQDLSRIHARLEVLETEGLEQNDRLQKLEAWREEALAQRTAAARQVQTLQVLVAVALSLAGVATLLSILFFTRGS